MRFQTVQALRAFAALAIVMLHSGIAVYWARDQLIYIPGISDYGWLGVQLFFCISGFIIAHVVSRPDFNVKTFLSRRAWRIYSLYWVVNLIGLAIFFSLGWWRQDVARLGEIGIIKSFFAFPLEKHPFINPGWSLEHEIIFYILAALVVPFIRLAGLFVLLIVLWYAGTKINFWDYHVMADAQIYFAAGIAAYWLRKTNPAALLALSLAALVFAYLRLYEVIPVAWFYARIAFAIGFSALIAGLASWEGKGLRVPRFIVILGDASYSLYLTHWLVIPGIGMIAYRVGGHPEIWRLSVIPCSIIIAIIIHYYVEKPLLRIKLDLIFSSRRGYRNEVGT